MRLNELRTACLVEQQLGTHTEVGMRGVEQDVADALARVARGHAAGFAEGTHVVAERTEPRGKPRDLGRLARTLATLERDEEPAHAPASVASAAAVRASAYRSRPLASIATHAGNALSSRRTSASVPRSG